MSDPGLSEATQRVMEAIRCERGTDALTRNRYCLTHKSGWLSDVNACGYAEGIASAAREDVADRIQQARADAWSEGFKAGRGADHQQCWWPANPYRAAAIRDGEA